MHVVNKPDLMITRKEIDWLSRSSRAFGLAKNPPNRGVGKGLVFVLKERQPPTSEFGKLAMLVNDSGSDRIGDLASNGPRCRLHPFESVMGLIAGNPIIDG